MHILNDLRLPRIEYTRKSFTNGVVGICKITRGNITCSTNKSGHDPNLHQQ